MPTTNYDWPLLEPNSGDPREEINEAVLPAIDATVKTIDDRVETLESAPGATVPSGTGLVHITSGVQDGAAHLVTDADVASGAGIAQSKISGLSSALAGKAASSHVHDAADITTGTLDPARIPVIASGIQIVSSGAIADLTSGQQSSIKQGAIVTTTDGRRWTYTGSGSKTSEASYIEMADVTPDWTVIANKPSTFAPSAHATSHQSSGTDQIKLDDLAAPDDNTDLNVSTGAHGLAPKLPGNTTTFLRGDGAYATPSITSNDLTLTEETEPSTPSSNTAKIYLEDSNGISRLRYKDDAARVLTLMRDSVILVKNVSGGTLSKGKAAYLSGQSAGVPTVALAKADTLSTTFETGLLFEDILSGGYGYLLKIGALANFDTSGLTAGAVFYLSSSVAGALTSTQPQAPAYSQVIGFCLTSHATTGTVIIFPRPASYDNFPLGRVAPSGGSVGYCIPGCALTAATATVAISANRIYYEPIFLNFPVTFDRIACEITTSGAAGKLIRMGIYNADTDNQPTSLVVDAGTVPADAAAGVQAITINQRLERGRYLLALHSDGAPTLRDWLASSPFALIDSALGANSQIVSFTKSSQTYAALASTGVAWDNGGTGGSGFRHMMVLRAAAFG